MNLTQAKSILRVVAIVLGIVSGISGLAGALSYAIHTDRVDNEKFFCAPDPMDHTFEIDRVWHAVCTKNGNLYISDKKK